MITKPQATIEDLYHVPEGQKAELVRGGIVFMSPTGGLPNRASGNIFLSLRLYERNIPHGFAFTDNAGFHVNLPHRQSFSPDAGFYIGNAPNMRFYEGAPVFAVEVRSENDYGPQAEQELADKRADYFAAGTLVVWDVDLQGEEVVRKYMASAPARPIVFRRGEIADAEPAVSGWQMAVDALFE